MQSIFLLGWRMSMILHLKSTPPTRRWPPAYRSKTFLFHLEKKDFARLTCSKKTTTFNSEYSTYNADYKHTNFETITSFNLLYCCFTNIHRYLFEWYHSSVAHGRNNDVLVTFVPPFINTLRPRHIAAISQTIFSNAFSWTKIYELGLQFNWSLFLRFELKISHHWFR